MIARTRQEGMLGVSDAEFAQFQRLIHREAGIHLADSKQALLVGRLARRVRELGLETLGEYYRCVVDGDGTELIQMIDAICTNETHFFREPRQFTLLGDRICEEWRANAAAGLRARAVRLWSAACSTGEEPYSIAMVLHDRLARDGWDIEILASDLSTRVLEKARAGIWPMAKIKDIPAAFVGKYMLRGVGEATGQAKVGPEARSLVRFQRANLRDEHYSVAGAPFDAIFCRNVLIYFDPPTRDGVIRRLLQMLVPGGYLFLGHAESLAGRPHDVETAMPAVYRVPLHPRSKAG